MNKKFGPFIKVGGVPVIGCEVIEYSDVPAKFKLEVLALQDNLPESFTIKVTLIKENVGIALFGNYDYYDLESYESNYNGELDVKIYKYKLINRKEVSIFEHNEKS